MATRRRSQSRSRSKSKSRSKSRSRSMKLALARRASRTAQRSSRMAGGGVTPDDLINKYNCRDGHMCNR